MQYVGFGQQGPRQPHQTIITSVSHAQCDYNITAAANDAKKKKKKDERRKSGVTY